MNGKKWLHSPWVPLFDIESEEVMGNEKNILHLYYPFQTKRSAVQRIFHTKSTPGREAVV